MVTSTMEPRVVVWRHGSPQTTIKLDSLAVVVGFSGDSHFVMTSGRDELRVWDVQSGVLVTSVARDAAQVISMTPSPSGDYTAVGNQDGRVTIFDTSSSLPARARLDALAGRWRASQSI
jgi:WD40 repeat protein